MSENSVEKTKPLKPSEILSQTLKLFGENGEYWGQGNYQHKGKYCLIGGVAKVSGESTCVVHGATTETSPGRAAILVMHQIVGPTVATFNDKCSNFTEVKQALCKGIHKALEIEEANESR